MDELTGLYNRRFMNETLKRKITEARRNSADLSLLMMDLDDFKKYNDSYGHIEGDRVLAAMGNVLIRTIRGADVACRYGGEEFLVILGNTDSVNAIHSAERIRSSLRQIDFKPSGEGAVNVTVSIGAVSLKPEEGAEDLIARADRALYMAKEGGRDRVVSI